jgi:hypothetical protein
MVTVRCLAVDDVSRQCVWPGTSPPAATTHSVARRRDKNAEKSIKRAITDAQVVGPVIVRVCHDLANEIEGVAI